MDSLLPILTALAATDAPSAERSKQTNGLTDFPAEEPSEKELQDWLEDNVTTVRKTHGALLRGETPPSLLKYDQQDDLTGIAEIPAPSSAETPEAASRRQAHNLKVRSMVSGNATHAYGFRDVRR